MRLLMPAAAAAAAVLAGCTQAPSTSTGKFRGEEKAVAQVVADLSDDATRNKPAHVCGEILTERLQKAVAGNSSCPDEVKKAFSDADTATLAVDDVTIDGTKATAVVSTDTRSKQTVRRTFTFEKVDGTWRIDSFG